MPSDLREKLVLSWFEGWASENGYGADAIGVRHYAHEVAKETALALIEFLEPTLRDAERYKRTREILRWQMARDRVMTCDEVDAAIDAMKGE